MLSDALTYPLRGAGKFRHLMGSLAIVFSPFIFPVFLLIGYYIHILTFVSVGHDEPPAVTSYKTLLKNGVIGSVITFTYTGFFIAAPLLVIIYSASVFTDGATMADVALLIDGIFFITLFFAIIMMSILPLILWQYASRGTFTAAYDVEMLTSLLRSQPVLKAIGLSVLIGICTAVLYTGFLILTLGFGLLLAPAVLFWFTLATGYLYGHAIGVTTGTIEPTSLQDIADEINTATADSNTGSKNG